MAQINKPSDYFNTKLYTGNGSTQSITGVGFQPDWVWFKNRSIVNSHHLYDSVRGATEALRSDTADAETTYSIGLTSFDSDGFSIGARTNINGSGNDIVSWSWLGGGTAVSNTDGDITSQVSANQTSGFSIVTYTGNGTSGTQVGHGLGSAPAVVLQKGVSIGQAWNMYHQGLTSASYFLGLNYTDAETNQSNVFSGNAPTSSTFYIGASGYGANNSGETYVAYCFAEKKGFSKFGSYIGNGSTDGAFVYTGFKPAFVLIKNSTSGGTHWRLADTKRTPFNTTQNLLFPSNSAAESTTPTGNGNDFQIFSNGFKITTDNIYANQSSSTFIYMCFAEQPLVGTNNIPATAR